MATKVGDGNAAMVVGARPSAKRSISSTIADVWKSMVSRSDTSAAEAGDTGSTASLQLPKRKRRKLQNKAQPIGGPVHEEPVILYQSEDISGRPPLLPLLPLQRLHLLRQRQYSEYQKLLRSVRSPSFLFDKPRNGSIRLRSNLSAPPVEPKSRKWSGEVQYDVAGTDQSEVPAATQKQVETGTDESSVITNSATVDSIIKDENSKNLSKAQKNLLINGPLPLPAKAQVSKVSLSEDKKETKGAKIKVLPTAGFDFIKDYNTPSKKQTPKQDSATFIKPLFSLGASSKDKENEPEGKNGALSLDDSTAKKPIFSFPSSQKDSKGEKVQGVSPSAPFTFGASAKTTISDKAEPPNNVSEDNKPTFSFKAPVADAKPSLVKPILVDTKSEKLQEEKPKSLPSFSFGTTASTTPVSSSKPFEIGIKETEEAKDDSKTAFSSASQSPSTTEPQAAKSSFSFSLPVKDTDAGKPSFNFGAVGSDKAPVEISQERPAFSFGMQDKEKSVVTSSSISKPFKFNAPPSSSTADEPSKKFPVFGSQDASTFSLGTQSNESKAPASAPTFQFGQKAEKANLSTESATTFTNGAPSFNFQKLSTPDNVLSNKPAPFGSGVPNTNATNLISGPTNTTNTAPAFSMNAPSIAKTNPFTSKNTAVSNGNTGFQIGKSVSQQNSVFTNSFDSKLPNDGIKFATSTSPAFGGFKTPTQPSLSTGFNPSSTVNLNFGNSTAAPSSIFTGGNVGGSSTNNTQFGFGGSTQPMSQGFSTAQTPAQIPGGNNNNMQASTGMFGNGMQASQQQSMFNSNNNLLQGGSTGTPTFGPNIPINQPPAFGQAQSFAAPSNAPNPAVRQLARMRRRR